MDEARVPVQSAHFLEVLFLPPATLTCFIFVAVLNLLVLLYFINKMVKKVVDKIITEREILLSCVIG